MQIQRLQDKLYRATNGVVLACICAHTWSPLLKRTVTSFPQSIFFAFITGAVKSDAVNQIAARKPTCSLILARTVFQIPLGGSKHFLALLSNLTSLERKIFQRAGQHPGQQQAPSSAPKKFQHSLSPKHSRRNYPQYLEVPVTVFPIHFSYHHNLVFRAKSKFS